VELFVLMLLLCRLPASAWVLVAPQVVATVEVCMGRRQA